MITYDLAVKLRDAGFEQEGDGTNSWDNHKQGDREELVYMPTLEELISACGDRFGELYHSTGDDWTAKGSYSGTMQGYGVLVKGATPSDAVASLWLAINSKK